MIVFILVAIASGCSSDDGNEVVIEETRALQPLSSAVIRKLKEGDIFYATLTIPGISLGLATTPQLSGEVAIMVLGLSRNPYRIPCRTIVYSGTLNGITENGEHVGTTYIVNTKIYQDENNSIYECGHYDSSTGQNVYITDTAATPNGLFLRLESPLRVGAASSAVSLFEDGSWQDCTITVESVENTSIPLGYFETFKTRETCTYSDGKMYSGEIWMVPEIYNMKEIGAINGLQAEIELNSYTLIED